MHNPRQLSNQQPCRSPSNVKYALSPTHLPLPFHVRIRPCSGSRITSMMSTGATLTSLASRNPRPCAIITQSPSSSSTGFSSSITSQQLPRATAKHRNPASSPNPIAQSPPASIPPEFAAYHAVAEQGIPFRDIATLIGNRLNLPVVSKSPAEAQKHLSFLGLFTSRDNPTSSQQTQQRLNWTPTHPTLFEDLQNAGYFHP
jgi:hypothetical protein